MNRLIKISLVLTLCFTIISSLEYKDDEEDYYADTDGKSRSIKDFSDDEDEEKPIVYDLKKAPELFEKFVEDYNKEYKNDEDYKKHYTNFVSNLRFINEVNSEGGSSSSDINLFSDLSDEEIANL